MEIFKYPAIEEWVDVLKRPALESGSLDQKVKTVLNDIRVRGDKAVLEYTLKFDGVSFDSSVVSNEEISAAENLVSDELKNAIDLAISNIEKFHLAQQPEEVRLSTTKGVECWQTPVAIEKVGLYIPGGTAPLFSTVLMLAIPAKIAGCKEIVLCSPPDKKGELNPCILYAAAKVGVTKIYKIGGVQAIGAMAYGTETVPKVYKIFGPGNQFVTAAKQAVSIDSVAIDMPAGPSEVAVIGDKSSNAAFIASDLLSQAEHGADSQVILFVTDAELISKVQAELDAQLKVLPRAEFAKKALSHSRIILLKDYRELMQMVNDYAPEHLIISTENADELAQRVINAGSVFIGKYTPESAGDYASGTNHTLPTNGWATAYSGVNLDSYYKKITFQKISKEGLQDIGPAIEVMAEAEELFAHKNAVTLRLKE